MNNSVNNSDILSENWCRKQGVAPLSNSATHCQVAVANPCDELLQEKIRLEASTRIEPVQKTPAEIKRILRKATKVELPSAKQTWESEPIINLVENLLEQSLEFGATDIHLEPSEKCFRIRLRQDGLLVNHRELPPWIAEPVLIRLKILAEVDITDKRIPHDGSFCYNGTKQRVNVRLSTLPILCESQGMEKCVLRLLPLPTDAEEKCVSLEQLGFCPTERDFMSKIFDSPQGLFLVTGPTGSGKTTTLHAGLQQIIKRQINVITVEDPVEYVLHGATQVQVNEKCGLTFASALRSILRQDPDVILVGEIRDSETAQIAIRAAQTGHLVLSTLHTSSAAAAYSRLRDLGIDQQSLGESLLGIVAQRLVRKRQEHSYKGRTVIAEILRPDKSYVNGSLQEAARRIVQQGITDQAEVLRVMGEF